MEIGMQCSQAAVWATTLPSPLHAGGGGDSDHRRRHGGNAAAGADTLYGPKETLLFTTLLHG
jgi:hypothetical protein